MKMMTNNTKFKFCVIVHRSEPPYTWVYGWYETEEVANAIATANNDMYSIKWGYTYSVQEIK